jgi:hypothetical protein
VPAVPLNLLLQGLFGAIGITLTNFTLPPLLVFCCTCLKMF